MQVELCEWCGLLRVHDDATSYTHTHTYLFYDSESSPQQITNQYFSPTGVFNSLRFRICDLRVVFICLQFKAVLVSDRGLWSF